MNRTKIENACVDWSFNDKANGLYKFLIPWSEHDFAPGDMVTVRELNCLDETTTATVEEVLEDGIIVKADWIDISEEYEITKSEDMNTEETTMEELLQQKLINGKITWLEFIQQGGHGDEFRQYCEENGMKATERTAQQFWDEVLHEEEKDHRQDAFID